MASAAVSGGLAARLRRARDRARPGEPVLVSWTQHAAPVDPLAFYRRGKARVYWERPSEGFALVGLGCVCLATSTVASAAARWHAIRLGADVEGRGPVAFAAFAFDPRAERGEVWRGMPDGVLLLPRLMLTVEGRRCSVTANVLVEWDADVSGLERELWAELRNGPEGATAPAASETRRCARSDSGAERWKREVAQAIAAIRRGEAEKIVLARGVRLRAVGGFDPAGALKRLRGSYPSCALFAIDYADATFMGATPERLVRARDGGVEVSSLAGTTARGVTPAEDERLGRELLASPKNRHEHAVVTEMLRKALAGPCVDLGVPAEPSLMKVRNVQHLYTPLTARLAPGASMLDLVERLHPTPAVGGLPREAALAFIREHEGLDRGWYAGPLGWIDAAGEGEMVVGLRSGLLRGDEATLFAGCGVMADSEPEAEYEESTLKLAPMLGALGVSA